MPVARNVGLPTDVRYEHSPLGMPRHYSSYRGNPVPMGWGPARSTSTTPNCQAPFSSLGAPAAAAMEDSRENSLRQRARSTLANPRRGGFETRPWPSALALTRPTLKRHSLGPDTLFIPSGAGRAPSLGPRSGSGMTVGGQG